MNDGTKNILIFSLGAAVGAVVTWKLVKTKYEQIAQEEIDSVKEMLSQRNCECNGEAIREGKEARVLSREKDIENPDLKEYAAKLTDYGYTNNEEEEEEFMAQKPYIISPDDFDTLDDYEAVTLTYYADGVLCDEWDIPIDDVDYLVGKENLTHFGENEDDPDTVYVRNDETMGDYEICQSLENYSDKESNYPTEG